METIMDFIRTDTFLIILAIFCIILCIAYIINIIKFSKLNKKYTNFMKKLSRRR